MQVTVVIFLLQAGGVSWVRVKALGSVLVNHSLTTPKVQNLVPALYGRTGWHQPLMVYRADIWSHYHEVMAHLANKLTPRLGEWQMGSSLLGKVYTTTMYQYAIDCRFYLHKNLNDEMTKWADLLKYFATIQRNWCFSLLLLNNPEDHIAPVLSPD